MFIYFYIVLKISNIFALHYLEDLLNLMTLGNYYRSFWGDLQRILLPALDSRRMGNRTRELYKVLLRKFPEHPKSFDMFHMGMAHCITSPIDGHLDKNSNKNWLRLIADMSTHSPDKSGKHWDI